MFKRSQVLRISFLLQNLLYLSWPVEIVTSTYKEDKPSHFQPNDFHRAGESIFDTNSFTSNQDESKLKLALLVDDKIDQNKDNLVQLDELVRWIKECHGKYAKEDVGRQWLNYDKLLTKTGGKLNWQDYIEKEYKHLVSLIGQAVDFEQRKQIEKSYDDHLRRDSKRWKAADLDKDDKLTIKEFEAFLYPEHTDYMHQIVLDEKIEFIDRDGDGRISIDEYLMDLSNENNRHYHLRDSESKDSWMLEAKEKFAKEFDQDGSKFLDKSEIFNWLRKTELTDDSVVEAQNLMQSADTNRDHRLSKEEILNAYHDFVNSHVTDFGEALKSRRNSIHDEL